ncbi:hypothetical protein LPB41_20255 [Thalassospira sp. MA62]|nr:hypothetical protein [Thalassospira sp. MA62]
MHLPLAQQQQKITQRCGMLANRIARDLAHRQRPDGMFPLPDFYGRAFAANLWARMDADHFSQQIDRALASLRAMTIDQRFHHEFIAYALGDMPGITDEQYFAILRQSRPQCPDVANWQVLGLINRQRTQHRPIDRLKNILHWWAIRARYWRSDMFMDRPGCFSAQYHAFCAALLSDSDDKSHRKIAARATALIARLCGAHGFANLIGRGAGQSFGEVCALYALTRHGFHDQANAILTRIEDTLERSETLPLNLIAPLCPLPDDPGPNTPQTPGWYSYNRHDDYLAFAGYWLSKTAALETALPPAGAQRAKHPASLVLCRHPQYSAQMMLSGRDGYDITPSPIIITGRGTDACLLLPPTGGEVDVPSLYGPQTIPLPALSDGTVARFASARRTHADQVVINFRLSEISGKRTIWFHPSEIHIHDHLPDGLSAVPNLFRILVDHRITLAQTSPNILSCPAQGITFSSDVDLMIDDAQSFSAAGPATRISAPNCRDATLTLRWTGDNHA